MNNKSYVILFSIIWLCSVASTATAAARLYATVSPSSAQVFVLNITPKFTQGMTLPPGTYKILVAKRGYKGVRKTITLNRYDTYLTATLVKDNSSKVSTLEVTRRYPLRVNVRPAGSRIRIMNINPKFTQGIRLLPGRYDILVTQSGYAPKRRWVTIKNKAVTLNWQLQRARPKSPAASRSTSTATKSALSQQASPVFLAAPTEETCFSFKEQQKFENHTTESVYQARVKQFPEFVKVDFLSKTQGFSNTFKFSGVQIGDKLELVGAVSYEGLREAVKASMMLEESRLAVNIEQSGELLLEHVLRKVGCSQVEI